MGADDQKLTIDVAAWLLNVTTSVVIIFINKAVMTVYKFSFPTTICGLHFLSCAGSIWAAEQLGITERARIPFRDALLFSIVGGISIGSANLSLLLNSVGFYQIAKLALAPFVCAVEIVWLRKRFTSPVLVTVAVVLTGVAIVTVTDVAVHWLGFVMALIFVISSGMQQIFCGWFQARFKISSHQLLANTSPVQGTLLLLVGPLVDRVVTRRWISEWEINVPGVEMLLLSCAVAVVVNLSQFLCLGRFSATSFQVLGHAKTVLVLLGGFMLFRESINHKQLSGMVLAVAGMVAYGYFSNQAAKVSTASQPPIAVTVPDATAQVEDASTSKLISREKAEV